MAKLLAIVSLMIVVLYIVGCARQPKVTMILNNDSYTYGELVNASIIFDKTIYVKNPWTVQRWEDGEWITQPQRKDFYCGNVFECSTVNWTDTIVCQTLLCEQIKWRPVLDESSYVWDQTEQVDKLIYECIKETNKIINQACVVFGQADPAKYQIVFTYATKINKKNLADDESIKLYNVTKEFRIKGNLLNSTPGHVNTVESGISFESIRDILKKANIHITSEGQESIMDLLSLARSTQEVLTTVCNEAGYNITPYLTMKVTGIAYPISETYKNASMYAIVLLNENQILCIYKKVSEESHIKPGLFSFKNPKFCESEKDCTIKYDVRYNEECSAGCFNTGVNSDSHCTIQWEMYSSDTSCSCFQQQCIINK